jgi:hypothetical protein
MTDAPINFSSRQVVLVESWFCKLEVEKFYCARREGRLPFSLYINNVLLDRYKQPVIVRPTLGL